MLIAAYRRRRFNGTSFVSSSYDESSFGVLSEAETLSGQWQLRLLSLLNSSQPHPTSFTPRCLASPSPASASHPL